VRVVVGKPIAPAGLTPESMTETAFQTIKQLLPEYEEPAGRKFLRRRLTHLF